MSKYNVYGLGNALVDMEFEVEDGFLNLMRVDKGVMTLVDEEEQHRLLAHLDAFEGTRGSGGSAANTLIAVSAMGGSSYYACKVADDELGHFYLHDLKAAGVDTNINGVHADGITGKCLVLVTPDAERTMQTYLGISAELSVHEISEPHIRESQYLYMEGYLVTSPSAREANIHARKIAEDLASDLGDFGVFVASGDEPSEEEIASAKVHLIEVAKKLVFEGDQEWARNHNYRLLSDLHRRAVKLLGLEREWAYEPVAMAECPACGERIKPNVALCKSCGAILDPEKARQFGVFGSESAGRNKAKHV